MNNMEILTRINDLQREINNLPKGYISKKTINGKIKYYLQWQEDGKKKSKYISDSDVEIVAVKIAERKKLQEELNILKKSPEYQLNNEDVLDYNTNIKVGNELIAVLNDVKNFKTRNCFKQIEDYLYSDTYGKVLILYGLRRTGKTTLIHQAIRQMNKDNLSRTAYIQISSNDTLANLNKDLIKLSRQGYQYIFIDEVTLLDDFIEGGALFSDVYASTGMKIVLSGTDSLGFMFAEDEQLYDRCIMIHTTFIPYSEFENVLGVKGIDEYIRYGGTMSLGGINYNKMPFENKSSTSDYVDTAIARNIQHSLKNYQYEGHFRALYDLYEKNELTSVINRVVEDINHRFTIEVLTKDFKSNDLAISANNLRKDKINGSDILDQINKEEVTKRIKEILEIKNKNEQQDKIAEEHEYEIKEYLGLLDLIVDIPIYYLPVSNEKVFKNVLTQPGMRYAVASSLIESLLNDKIFQDLSAIKRNEVIIRILSEIKGRMMEDLVLLETKIKYPYKSVFKLQFPIGEFDMVIVDEALNCDIFEIKYSDKIIPEQYKNLIDQDKCDKTSFRYGNINNKYVIYRGPTTKLDNGIIYLNVEEYLKELYK